MIMGVEPVFWVELILLLAGMIMMIMAFNSAMRKFFKVEKQKPFTNVHMNDVHKKADWTVRGFVILYLIVGHFANIHREPAEQIWYFNFIFILVVSIVATEGVQAVMEKKYAENPNAYKLTLSRMIFVVLLLLVLIITDFFGLI
ncbi:DUF4181 domain-containing protein [Alkalicoccus daliensis]|uniref:DUF4181 domain-containing protein n=1 Tax=Alkalicoccus daliensis TaxID=745820 RepID=A0A1H0CQD7_9BACI|nr:DUF4181 domain-containing protein [Alkalicoccus daliensis]SDN60058.1 protein of unknown function [Alkalicoccus daliensis]